VALSGLITDWGGVLTVGLREAVDQWADQEGIRPEDYVAVMRQWFGRDYGIEAAYNPVHALEKGELEVPQFEEHLAQALSQYVGRPVPAAGLVSRMLSRFRHAPDMMALVRRAKERGIRTGLLSNSWGNTYPDDLFDGMFDVVVISGEVGMRKPEPRIFEHTLDLIGLAPEEVVFVDDLRHNIEAAVAVGLVGVLHTSYAETLTELEALFDRDLS